MRNSRQITGFLFTFGAVFAGLYFATSVPAQVERFTPAEGAAIEVWKITDDPTVRDHANYHNQ
ncbi:MAG: hypothetical protein HQ582_01090 [Planctomycetes bacterium]|nr:hypothetical protein [Planctomycetota bacterium]